MEQDKELVEEILKLIREYRAIEKKKEMIYSENTLRDMERQVKIIGSVYDIVGRLLRGEYDSTN
jgi:hypothetical protein